MRIPSSYQSNPSPSCALIRVSHFPPGSPLDALPRASAARKTAHLPVAVDKPLDHSSGNRFQNPDVQQIPSRRTPTPTSSVLQRATRTAMQSSFRIVLKVRQALLVTGFSQRHCREIRNRSTTPRLRILRSLANGALVSHTDGYESLWMGSSEIDMILVFQMEPSRSIRAPHSWRQLHDEMEKGEMPAMRAFPGDANTESPGSGLADVPHPRCIKRSGF